MSKTFLPAVLAILLFSLVPPIAARPSGQAEKLEKKYETWLKDEVNYLITDEEQKLFLLLKTNRERDVFINSFWARRDPVPLTPANEFKEEHYRRLAAAKDKYGIHSDRGRIYILLGPPDSIDNETSGKYVFPCEIWNYENLSIPSLPNALRLLFFKQWGVGEFRLYSPLFDGLEYLIAQRHYDTREGDDAAIRKLLRDYVGPDFLLATESVSPGMDRLQSERVLNVLCDTRAFASLRPSPGRAVVTTSVTYERLPFEVAGFFADDGHGNAFYDAGLAVQPSDLTFEKTEAKYHGRQDVYVTVRDGAKNVVAQFNDQLSTELTEEEFSAKKNYGLSYSFSVLLVPGDYLVNILLRDFVSNRVGERDVQVSVPASPRATPLLLAGREERLPLAEARPSGAAAGKTPFTYGDVKVLPRVNAAFGREETIFLYFEVYPRPGDSGQYRVRYAVRDAKGAEVLSETEGLAAKTGERVLSLEKSFSPRSLRDGEYSLVVAVTDAQSGAALSEQSVRFAVSPATRPEGTFAFVQPYNPAPEVMYTGLGNQCLFRKDFPKAREFFTLALSFAPGCIPAKVQLARCHVLAGEEGPALDLLLPLAKAEVESGDIYTILANIYYGRKDLDQAILYLSKAAEINVESVEVLNFLGGVYMEKGDRVKARQTFARSLQIKKDQPLVKAALERLGPS